MGPSFQEFSSFPLWLRFCGLRRLRSLLPVGFRSRSLDPWPCWVFGFVLSLSRRPGKFLALPGFCRFYVRSLAVLAQSGRLHSSLTLPFGGTP